MKPRHLRGIPSLALLPFVFAGALFAQQKPDPLRVLRAMEVEGVAAFDRDRIAGALVLDSALMRELQRPLDPEVAAAVADRVEELHRRGGYLQAKAHGEVAAGVVTVRLVAGPRSACGAIRIEGNVAVPTALLRERLTMGGTTEPLWTEGAFATQAAEVLRRRAVALVTVAYLDAGRHGVAVQAELSPEGGTVVLRVKVTDEGHEVRVQRLALQGDDAASAAVLAGVTFAPGILADTKAIEALQRQLEATGRYFEVRPLWSEPVPATLDPLVFAVKVRPNAPAPGQLQPGDVAQVRAMIDKVVADLRGGRVLRLQTSLNEGDVSPLLRVLPGLVTVAFGNRGVELTAERTQWTDGEPGRAAVRFAADALTVELGDRAQQWRFGEALGVQFTVNTSFTPDGEAGLRWGVALSTASQDLLATTIHPATAAHLLTRATSIRRDGEVLVVEFPVATLRIAADGALAGDAVEFVDGERKLQVGWSTERLDARGRPAEAVRGSSPAAMVLDCAGRLARAHLTTATEPRVRALVLAAIDATATLPIATSPDGAEVDMPSLADSGMAMDRMVLALAGRLAVDRRIEGDLVAVATAFAALLRGDGTAGAHFGALAETKSAGPLLLGCVSRLLGVAGIERAAASFRDVATDRCTFAAFYRDAAGLGANLTAFASVPAHVGAAWRAVPEMREVFADLPPDAEGDLAAWRKGLEILWQSGGEAWVRGTLLGR